MTRTIAIIPARAGSKRVPGKNVRPFLGRPLIAWTVEFALQSGLFDAVVVSTDGSEIADAAAAAGPVGIRWRPAALATDEAGSVGVALDVLDDQRASGQEFDAVALLQPTTPIRRVERWRAAAELLDGPDCPAVIGVSPAREHPSHAFSVQPDRSLRRWVETEEFGARSQDLAPVVMVNGALYLIRAQILREERSFLPAGTRGVVCDTPVENIDIDTEWDWRLAEATVKMWNEQ